MVNRIEWNLKGFHDLRSDPALVADLERRGEALAEACGGEEAGYVVTSEQGESSPQGRWQVSVIAASEDARIENGRDNTLIRNLGAASD
jgi:hypothetical protein